LDAPPDELWPQIGDTFNHLFGATLNPINRKLSPGGSSGGEGALIAMKGSILGVVRHPSPFRNSLLAPADPLLLLLG